MSESSTGWHTARGEREKLDRANTLLGASTSSGKPSTPLEKPKEYISALPPKSGAPGAPSSPLDIGFVRVFARRVGLDEFRKEVMWFRFAIRACNTFQWGVEKRYSECLQLYQRISVLGLEHEGKTLEPFPAKSGFFVSRGESHLASRQAALDTFFSSLLGILQSLASSAIFEQSPESTSIQGQRVAYSLLLNFLRNSATTVLDIPSTIDRNVPIDAYAAEATISREDKALPGSISTPVLADDVKKAATAPPPYLILASESTLKVVIMLPGIDITALEVGPSAFTTNEFLVVGDWPTIEMLEPEVSGLVETANTLPKGTFEIAIETPSWASQDDFSLTFNNGCVHLLWRKPSYL